MLFSTAPRLALGALALTSAVTATDPAWQTIPPIEAVGQHFFYSNNGSQFFLMGVAYQQNFSPNGSTNPNITYTDPLADASSCERDIPYIKKLFSNVIRVYALDPTADHDDCMQMLAENDIYVVADLGEPSTSINSDDPEWNVPLYQRYASVIDTMNKYQNLIGFFAGNEVVEQANQTAAAAFVKAAVRDMKSYIKTQKYRSTLGVGYATADVPARDQLAHYFACEPEDGVDSTIDFWGYNVYSWCGDSNYITSSYNEREEFFSDYPVPVFFAEYGCNQGLPGGPYSRPFTEVPVLFGNMTNVFSGGIVYEYFDDTNQYGLVSVDGNDVTPKPDYTSLMNQLAKVTLTPTQSSTYKPTNTAPACPTQDSSWVVQPSPIPPSVNVQLCNCEMEGLTCTITSTDATQYGAEFGYICGQEDGKYCAGIQHNATTGTYGAISGCSAQQQLAFVANQYYLDQDSTNQASACDFNGLASTQSPQTTGSCSSLIEAAGTDGTGTVVSPTGGASGDTSDSAAISSLRTPTFFNFGGTFFVLYVVIGLVSGIGMIVL
ncbi:Glucanosyltransferase-domain-containing protein [Xylariaceae sp. FL0255]|nr:Glucanosyltransferase-domain-containing protein [Xylariaceae sp. FL0255]